ncbi:MAG: PAS domain-containing sensor histidine kinase [Acidobacteria bacterium]|nr:MAG: PAS domain-containing sensor histidine kinase [Acidobacteriota bacterium]
MKGNEIRKFLKLTYEQRIFLLTLAGGLPALVVALILVWSHGFSARVEWTLTLFLVACWFGFAGAVFNRVVYPLQTLANLLAALREGDYSIRGRRGRIDDALGQVFHEVNLLGLTLRGQRLSAVEAEALLRAVMTEIEVTVLAFDGEHRLKLANRAGERLLAPSGGQIIGRTAEDLGLAECLEGENAKTADLSFPGGSGRWGIRVNTFWEQGLPHKLVVLADLTQALRREELQVWKRLVRVIGHELNNSLTPIKSIACSLTSLLSLDSLPDDWRTDANQGLTIIAGRVESLLRFMEAYARLAKLPPPKRRPMEVGPWIRRVVDLETRLSVRLKAGPEMTLSGDGDQLDQLLINVLRNGVDAALQTGGGVEVGWRASDGSLEVWIRDEGPGLASKSNLFVPFFTTKPGGSGIGLVLSRQIAEGHGGSLTLENRKPGPGCEALLRLPL